jgi:hypothetical protein
VDPKKVEDIMEWYVSTNVPEVRISFMGSTGYYRWFIEGFLNIENPIMEV